VSVPEPEIGTLASVEAGTSLSGTGEGGRSTSSARDGSSSSGAAADWTGSARREAEISPDAFWKTVSEEADSSMGGVEGGAFGSIG
jgi:hypothetical protein